LALDELIAAINDDPELQRRGRYYTCQLKLVVGDRNVMFSVENGQLARIDTDVTIDPDGITLAADADAWRRHRESLPAPGFHDIAAMQDQGHLSISGDVVRWLSNMGYVRGLVKHWSRSDVCSP